MRNKLKSLLRISHGLFAAAVVVAAAPAHAAIELADSPLFLTVAVPPNITLTIDDSGSMARAFVPDTCGATSNDCSALDNPYPKSAYSNRLYYNPNVIYPPAKMADGDDYTTSFTSAGRHGFDSGFTSVNLQTDYRPTAALDLPPGGTAAELYMGHYSRDFRCNTSSSTPYCQYSTNKGSTWITPPSGARTDCWTGRTGNSTSAVNDRNNFCRGTQGSGYTPARMPAHYYVMNPTNSGCPTNASQRTTDVDCYDLVIVSSTSGPGTVDQNGDGALTAADKDERQNFANWFSFARTRMLATATASSLAFNDLSDDVRVAWQGLHTCRNSATNFVDTDCDGWRNNFSGISNRLRAFGNTHKENFYRWIAQLPTNDTTPLPAAMQRVGEYYRRGGDNNPYDSDLENTGSVVELSCRRNYHVMMTDGIWNNAIAVTGGNVDNRTQALPESGASGAITQYTPQAPYSDGHSNTLADLAFYYWVNDLRSTLTNDVLPNYRDTTGGDVQNYWNPRNDPATWQHMVNFTIGLGLTDYLSQTGLSWNGNMYGGSYPSIAAGTTAWPEPGNDRAANVADLWHAAINSRGQFFSADDPTSLAVAFRSALTAITDSSGSSAALSANSTSIQPNNTFVYQAKFDARDWSGTVLALAVGMDGRVNPNPAWDASQQIPNHASRSIFTFNGTAGTTFTSCSNLSAAQQSALNTHVGGNVDGQCANRLQWLRGNSSMEVRNGGIFRNRPRTVMGDVINSDPGYVKDIDYGYGALPGTVPGASTYDAYVSGNANRDAMVYVGANDGHMHALRASNGAEAFSYIPMGVYSNLSALTDPSYAHRHLVDGAITVGDAYLNGSWRSVLVAGLNSGGKTIYALDVTNPGSFASSNVMWEYSELDLGYTFSQPQIGILQNGQWVAVFGNGYNSAGGGAHLYILNLQTGALIRKITASDAGGDESNGLSTPRLFDSDGDRMIDSIYAGDLHGNMWKFDVSGGANTWDVAYGGALFSAGTSQPITAQPKVGGHPNGGHLVVFGTGQYLGPSDVADGTRQSFYGIWDNGSRAGGRNTLQRQDIATRSLHGRSVRTVTNYTPDWGTERGWYVDLPASGERSVSTPVIFQDRVIFVTIVPSSDACSPGGTSWLMELKFQTGGTFNGVILDIDNDGSFSNDLIENADVGTTEVAIGVEMNLGISKTVTLIESAPSDNPVDTPLLFKIATGTSGGLETITNCPEEGGGCEPPTPTSPPGVSRRSWIQIR